MYSVPDVAKVSDIVLNYMSLSLRFGISVVFQVQGKSFGSHKK